MYSPRTGTVLYLIYHQTRGSCHHLDTYPHLNKYEFFFGIIKTAQCNSNIQCVTLLMFFVIEICCKTLTHTHCTALPEEERYSLLKCFEKTGDGFVTGWVKNIRHQKLQLQSYKASNLILGLGHNSRENNLTVVPCLI